MKENERNCLDCKWRWYNTRSSILTFCPMCGSKNITKASGKPSQ